MKATVMLGWMYGTPLVTVDYLMTTIVVARARAHFAVDHGEQEAAEVAGRLAGRLRQLAAFAAKEGAVLEVHGANQSDAWPVWSEREWDMRLLVRAVVAGNIVWSLSVSSDASFPWELPKWLRDCDRLTIGKRGTPLKKVVARARDHWRLRIAQEAASLRGEERGAV